MVDDNRLIFISNGIILTIRQIRIISTIVGLVIGFVTAIALINIII